MPGSSIAAVYRLPAVMEESQAAGSSVEEQQALVARFQQGDGPAWDTLVARFQPLMAAAISPVWKDPYFEDLPGEALVALRDLLMRFDPTRGVYPATYLGKTLPARMRQRVRRERLKRGREVPWTALTEGAKDESGEEEELVTAIEGALSRRTSEGTWWSGAPGSLEGAVVERVTLETALASLPPQFPGRGRAPARAVHVRGDRGRVGSDFPGLPPARPAGARRSAADAGRRVRPESQTGELRVLSLIGRPLEPGSFPGRRASVRTSTGAGI